MARAFNEHIIDYFRNCGIALPSQHRCLPLLYWLPKLHKQPYGTRFIATWNKCTTKPLSRLLTSCFKLITKHYEQYCNGIFCRTGINCFWIINNSQQVLSTLNRINYFSTARHLIVMILLHSTLAFHMQHLNKLRGLWCRRLRVRSVDIVGQWKLWPLNIHYK